MKCLLRDGKVQCPIYLLVSLKTYEVLAVHHKRIVVRIVIRAAHRETAQRYENQDTAVKVRKTSEIRI